ncbi:MAG: N-acetyltransferase [Sphingobacteriales bacterium]|nr:MAG: N-acetyltransferase [Sphingobacteriales bacterium]
MTSLCWDKLQLTAYNDSYTNHLFVWRNTSLFLSNLTARPAIDDLRQFKTEIQRDFSTDRHEQFVILVDEYPVGTIYSYSLNKIDKYCFVSVFIIDTLISSGFGAKATILFCRYLFDKYELYKIYFDIYDYNKLVVALLKKKNISLEGEFKRQHIHNGTRHDVLRFALYKKDIEDWEQTFIPSR